MGRESIDRFVEQNREKLVELIQKISSISSPTGKESEKAHFVKSLLDDLPGSPGAEIDQAGNVLLRIDGKETGNVSLAVAHIDTVFEDAGEIHPEIKGGYIYAPSAGDNSANVAGLISAAEYLLANPGVSRNSLLFAFSVGEEGMGNLRGMRHIMEKHGDIIKEVIAVDGGCDKVMNFAVSSKRFSVKVSAEGGHSWYDFGNSNAVTIAAEIIGHIYSIQVPVNPRTTYNIGLFNGGRSINSIAEDAEFTMDMRSLDHGALQKLEEDFIAVVEETALPYSASGSRVDITLLAERPGGKTPETSRIVRKVLEARELAGLDNEFYPSSTDANIPMSLEIPSVTFGIYRGEGAHTVHERIEIGSLDEGMRGLLYSLVNLSSPNGLI